jgi:spermidine synthase
MNTQKPYLEQHLTFKDKGDIYDEEGRAIMMEWETPLMEKYANIICSKGGDILNIGYGMGIIDNYIQSHNPKTHWIVEAHPQIQKQMCKKGWLKKSNVRCIFDTWQNVSQYLPKFNGIFIDTFDAYEIPFYENVHKMLKFNGIFSFFYTPSSFHTPLFQNALKVLEKNFEIKYQEVSIPNIPSLNNQGNEPYFDNIQNYKIPYFYLKN